MKYDAWVLPLISLLALSVSPADAQAALRGLQRGGGRGGGRAPPQQGGSDRGVGRGVDVLLGNGKGELSVSGRTRMIVTVDDDDREGPATKCARLARASGGTVGKVFHRAMKGCTIELSNAAVTSMGRNSMVKHMEPDQKVQAYDIIDNPTWGLDRTDQCGPIGTAPTNAPYEQMDAGGTRVYILDTGVKGDHPLLAEHMSNADCHIDIVGEGNAQVDNNGHGTHVAGTACGDTYGVATNCDICAVKVLGGSGSGSSAGVLEGIEFVMENCEAAPPGTKCVANMSLGGGFSQDSNDAVARAVEAGVVFVVAAGNSNDNACNYSPASAPAAITVGSTTEAELKSGFSNKGTCVDVDAPGSGITSTWNNGQTRTISGTSMASPHVAGLAAGIMGEAGLELLSPDQVWGAINAKARNTGVDDGTGRQIRVANNKGGCNAPTAAPTPAPPCTPQQTKVTVNVKTDNYPGETTWTVTDISGNQGEVVFEGGPYSASGTQYSDESSCLNPATYRFKIMDSYGDGICCSYGSGNYEVLMGGVSQGAGGSFGSEETVDFTHTPPPGPSPTNPPVPAPTNPPVPAPTNPPTPNPTNPPTPNPTNPPTPNPTNPPTPNPTNPPTPNPTNPPTPNPTNPVTEAPTYKTCSQYNINECTTDKGCQWTGNCKNCGCQLCTNGDPSLCPASSR